MLLELVLLEVVHVVVVVAEPCHQEVSAREVAAVLPLVIEPLLAAVVPSPPGEEAGGKISEGRS